MKTKTEFLQDIVEDYRSSGETWPATAKHIAAWAIRSQRWKPKQSNMVGQCASEIAEAMRDEFYTDPQGRKVRRKHAYRESTELPDGRHVQLFLWIDVQDAEPEQVETAFRYSRRLIAGDCKQLKTDVDSYNDNNKHGVYVEMSFDFRDDMEEGTQPVEYPGL